MAFVIIKVLQHSGLLDLIGQAFAPIMGIFGLPGEAATVLLAVGCRWAAASASRSRSLTRAPSTARTSPFSPRRSTSWVRRFSTWAAASVSSASRARASHDHGHAAHHGLPEPLGHEHSRSRFLNRNEPQKSRLRAAFLHPRAAARHTTILPSGPVLLRGSAANQPSEQKDLSHDHA